MKQKTGYPSIDKPWLQFYEEGSEQVALDYPKDKTIWEVYKPILESYGNIPVVEYYNHSFSAQEYIILIEKWAKTFRAMGIEPDEMVPIYGSWSPDIAAMFFSLNAIGAHPYFQKLDITLDALEKETASAKVAVVHSSLWANVQDVFKEEHFKKVIVSNLADNLKGSLRHYFEYLTYLDGIKNKSLIPNDKKFIKADQAREIGNDIYTGTFEEPFKPGRLASITTSSGTSSAVVKGIMDTNESILANIIGTSTGKPNYIEGHKVLTSTPPTASTSLNCLYLLPIYKKMTSILDPRVSEKVFYEQIMKYKPSITIMTGAYMEYLFREIEAKLEKGKQVDLSFADFYTIGGSGTTPEKLEKMNQIMDKCNAPSSIFIGYGSSELFGVVSVDKNHVTNENASIHDVTDVGIPLPGFNIKVIDDDGKELPYNTRGELCITGPSLSEGYYKKEDLTNMSFKDGWFVTGDICTIDENGYIYYFGRKKDTVNIGQKKAYLFDIARAIRKEFDLQDCFVELKKLENKEDSICVYFVQKPENHLYSNKELCMEIDNYTKQYGINIDGYLEFDIAIPTSPTTIKPVTRVMEGFIKYDLLGNAYDVNYSQTKMDDILKISRTLRKEELILTRKR